MKEPLSPFAFLLFYVNLKFRCGAGKNFISLFLLVPRNICILQFNHFDEKSMYEKSSYVWILSHLKSRMVIEFLAESFWSAENIANRIFPNQISSLTYTSTWESISFVVVWWSKDSCKIFFSRSEAIFPERSKNEEKDWSVKFSERKIAFSLGTLTKYVVNCFSV